jgi:hypothetical protein
MLFQSSAWSCSLPPGGAGFIISAAISMDTSPLESTRSPASFSTSASKLVMMTRAVSSRSRK